jgi:hypothetical protein
LILITWRERAACTGEKIMEKVEALFPENSLKAQEKVLEAIRYVSSHLVTSVAWSSSNPGKLSRFFTLIFSSTGLEFWVRSERYVSRHEFCRPLDSRLL